MKIKLFPALGRVTKTKECVMKNTIKWFGIIVMVAVIGFSVAVPAFANGPTAISGVWLRENIVFETMWGGEQERQYYYFYPRVNDGTGTHDGLVVGIAVTPDILGGQQVAPFAGIWNINVLRDGVRQVFAVHSVRAMLPTTNRFLASPNDNPAMYLIRFFTENGVEKLELTNADQSQKEVWTKIGASLSDLPELGPLAREGNTGGRFWGRNGITFENLAR